MRNTTATTIEPRQAHPRALGYQFDPIPSALKADRRLGHLNDRDLIVASEMIAMAHRGGRDDSVWCTKAVIAGRLGVSERTVQASWARLRSRGWIVERAVGSVDPLDHRNRTGRRFWFAWIAGAQDVTKDRPGEKEVAPGGEKVASPNKRNTRISEKTTNRPVVVPPELTVRDAGPANSPTPDERADVVKSPVEPEAHPLPAPLAEVMADAAIDDQLRRKLGRLIPHWLGVHPIERVEAALKALLKAAKRERIDSPVGYVFSTLRQMAKEKAKGEATGGMGGPGPVPTRTPDADSTADRLAQIRREEATMAEWERRWASLPEADRRRIEAQVEAGHPRPAGIPERLWRLTRHAACLERMEEDGRPPAQPASRTRRMT